MGNIKSRFIQNVYIKKYKPTMIEDVFSNSSSYIISENFFKETMVLFETELDYCLKVNDGFYIDTLNEFARVSDVFVDRNRCTTYKLVDKIINDDESWNKAVDCRDEVRQLMDENQNLKQSIMDFNKSSFFEKLFKKIKI